VTGFIDHLYTRLGSTSTYSTTAKLHNSQITTAPAKNFRPCCVFICFLATASNSGDSSASRAQIRSSQPPVQNSTLNCNLNYSAISFQPPLQSATELVAQSSSLQILGADRVDSTPFPPLYAQPLPRERVYRAVV
jgi:hypothetical protein